MINLSIKLIRTVFDVISLSAMFYLPITSLSGNNSPFQSFVLYPSMLLTLIGLAYFIHNGLNKCAKTISGYQIKIIKTQAVTIRKQPLAH